MSLEDVPSALADFLEINVGSAKVLLSISVVFTLLLPVLYLSKGKNATLISLAVILLAEMLLVGLGWLDFWVLIATVVMMAAGFALNTAGIVTGE